MTSLLVLATSATESTRPPYRIRGTAPHLRVQASHRLEMLRSLLEAVRRSGLRRDTSLGTTFPGGLDSQVQMLGRRNKTPRDCRGKQPIESGLA